MLFFDVARYRRNGTNVDIEIALRGTSGSAGTGGGEYTITLPPGINSAVTGNMAVGSALFTSVYSDNGVVFHLPSYGLRLNFSRTASSGNSIWSTTNYPLSNTQSLTLCASLPIAEWAGSGTVNLAQNDVEYVSHNGTSVVYGPAGAPIPTSTPAGAAETFSLNPAFLNAQSGDVFLLETQRSGVGPWMVGGSSEFTVLNWNGTNYFGATVIFDGTNVAIRRGKYMDSGNTTWSTLTSGTRWRVRKTSAGAAVSFGLVSANSSGLMPASNANLDDATATRLGLKQYVHGSTYNGGNAPTVGGTNVSSVTRGVLIPRQMQDGTWRLTFSIQIVSSSVTTVSPTVNGITSNTVARQAFTASNSAVNLAANAAIDANTNSFVLASTSASTAWYFAGDIELASKPTWAY